MVRHSELGTKPFQRSRQLYLLLEKHPEALAGNAGLKIYGNLTCTSGKRLKAENRVFFIHEEEAIALGYRPCGHCLKEQYSYWKSNRSA